MGLVRHMVVCKFKSGVSQEKAAGLLELVRSMKGRIPGIVSIEAGPYESPEGLNQGFTHGFLVTFESPAARDGYLPHPEHDKVRDALLEHIESVVAFDFEVRE